MRATKLGITPYVLLSALLLTAAAPAAIGQTVESRLGLGRVFSLDWNHDGTRYVTAHERTVEVFDAATDESVLRLPRHPDRVQCVAYSPNGDRIATCTWYGIARVFDSTTGTLLLSLRGWQWTNSVRFTADGDGLLVGGLKVKRDGAPAVLYDSRTGRRLVSYPTGNGIYNAEITPDKSRVVAKDREKRLRIFDGATGEMLHVVTLEDKVNAHRCLALSPDGTKVAVARGANEVVIYDVATADSLLTLTGHEDTVWAVDWSADGTRILSGSADRTARVWSAESGTELDRLTGFTGGVDEVAFSPNGTRALVASSDVRGASVWDLATGQRIGGRPDHDGWQVKSAAWSPDETQVLTATDLDSRIWNVARRELVGGMALPAGGGVVAAWTPAGPRFVSWDDTNEIHLWNAGTGEELAVFAGHSMGIADAVFTADGAKMFTASFDGTVNRMDVASGRQEWTYSGHAEAIRAIALSPDETLYATASLDTTVQIRDVETGALRHEFTAPKKDMNCVAFSPDASKLIAGGNDKIARIWNVKTGKLVRTLDHGIDILCVAWSADGRFIATAGGYPYLVDPIPDSVVRVWNADSGGAVQSFPAHFHNIRDIRFDGSGDRLLTAGIQGTAVVWDRRNPAPKISLGPTPSSDRVSVGQRVRWSVEIKPGGSGVPAVHWSFGDGATATGLNPEHAYSRPGTYRTCVTVSDGATHVMKATKIVVGDPLAEAPKLVLRLDFRRTGRDRLKLRSDGPFDLPPGGAAEGAEIEVDIVAAVREVGTQMGVRLTLDRKGRAEGDGVKLRLRRVAGTDRYRLSLTMKNQDFGLADKPEDGDRWNDNHAQEAAPVSVCVRIDGRIVWNSTEDHRYRAKEDRKGRLRR